MKKLFLQACGLWPALAAACSDEKDEPNDESGSIVGEWVFQRTSITGTGNWSTVSRPWKKEDKAIAIFRKTEPIVITISRPRRYYDGTYSYDEMSGVLTTDDGVNEQTCLTEITVSTMKWIYDEGDGEVLVEYYSRK